MKRVFSGFVCLAVVFALAVPAWAGGDKVRGDKGKGEVVQTDADSQGNQK